MADVSVRELRKRLSEYLDRAERSEFVRVTDRGGPKALLGQLPGNARVEEGVAGGWITPGSGAALRTLRRRKASRRILDVVGEDRGGAL
jgi:antitoxin (DNA-binding transcriptional repressor) of toxin-antitoxin stability system